MTKAQFIEKYGIEWYEEYKARKNAETKERYKNNPEYKKALSDKHKERYKNDSEFRATILERSNERYKNDPDYRATQIENVKARQKERWKNDPEFREYHKEYQKNCTIINGMDSKEYYREYNMKDLNSNGKTKDNIRTQSRYILFKQRQHTKFNDYEIHHCFGYEDPSKFIYIPKTLHNKIHQYLRDNKIDADSNHYEYIKHMINECIKYTYISV